MTSPDGEELAPADGPFVEPTALAGLEKDFADDDEDDEDPDVEIDDDDDVVDALTLADEEDDEDFDDEPNEAEVQPLEDDEAALVIRPQEQAGAEDDPEADQNVGIREPEGETP